MIIRITNRPEHPRGTIPWKVDPQARVLDWWMYVRDEREALRKLEQLKKALTTQHLELDIMKKKGRITDAFWSRC